jgi:hypothetical protein
VRRYDADKVAGRDYLGLFPEFWEMPLVAGYQVIGAGGIRTFQELVIVWIYGWCGFYANLTRWQKISSCLENASFV